MEGMFMRASSFNQNLSSWDTSRAKAMNGVFGGASSFNGDLSSWNVSQVTDLSGMFYSASSFNGKISSWDTSRSTNMNFMFFNTSKFQQILCWDTMLASKTEMFRLSGGSLSTFPYPSCLTSVPTFRPSYAPTIQPSGKPSSSPTYRPSAASTIWPKSWLTYKWDEVYGTLSSNLKPAQKSCSPGHKIKTITVVAGVFTGDWVRQLSATCTNDETSGPWGDPNVGKTIKYTSDPCPNGYNGWNITHGPHIYMIRFNCSNSNKPSKELGLSSGIGSRFSIESLPKQNQSLVGFYHVQHNKSGVYALGMGYAEFNNTKCYDSFGEWNRECPSIFDYLAILWGFLSMMTLGLIVCSILAYKWSKKKKKEFKAIDNLLPFK